MGFFDWFKPKKILIEDYNKFEGQKIISKIRTKVVGVSYKNDDGTSRQNIIKNLRVNQYLDILHVPNKYDKNAVAVFLVDSNLQVGHLNAELAEEIAPMLDNGNCINAVVIDLTGGEYDKPTRGCNIEIREYT
jgi:hypothetical protein